MIIGRSISDAEGVIQAIDAPVAAILQRTQEQLIGQSYLAITHPDDLALNMAKVAALEPDGRSACIRKRYIGGWGDIIRLEVQVERRSGCNGEELVGTLSTIDARSDLLGGDQTQYRLWHSANDLLNVMQARDELLGADLFADHAWRILLLTYVAEAEGRIAASASVADHLGVSPVMVERWLRALRAKYLIEPGIPGIDALQLTQVGIAGVERLLENKTLVPIA